MCKHNTTVQMPIAGRVRNIDQCISHIVAALNAGGVTTVASCCGHGNRPGTIALDDGRSIAIFGSFEEESEALNGKYPDIHGDWPEMKEEASE